MKSNPNVYTSIREGYVNTVVPVLTGEWNQNRYYDTKVTNYPDEAVAGYDVDAFPISHITKPHRPVTGIAKAIANYAVANNPYQSTVPATRWYTVAPNSKYKYWMSPYKSNASSPYAFPNADDAVTSVRPAVEYQTGGSNVLVYANKIRMVVERSIAYPTDFDVQVKNTTGGAWTTVITSPTIEADGSVSIYWNGTAWTTTRDITKSKQIAGVRLVVRKMNMGNVYLSLLELGARYEIDLTKDLSATSDEQSYGDVDFISPVGTVAANTGSITLFNENRRYTNDNPSSDLYGLLDKYVRLRMYYRYDNDPSKDIQAWEYFTNKWSEDIDETTVDMVDGADYLQAIKPPQLLYQNITAQEALWRTLDSIGYSKYKVNFSANDVNPIIDVFWTTGEDNIWDVFTEVSKAHQIAIYFDSDGFLRVRMRNAAFDSTRPSDWTLRGSKSGTELPDIISLTDDDEYEANTVDVEYTPTYFSRQVGQIVPYEVVWEPGSDNTDSARGTTNETIVAQSNTDNNIDTDDEADTATTQTDSSDVVTLRANSLVKDLPATGVGSDQIWVGKENAATWQHFGYAQIEGEIIEYNGKPYNYFTDATTSVSVLVKSYAEQKKWDAVTPPNLKYMNYYTGYLQVSKRGYWNTPIIDHTVASTGWKSYRKVGGAAAKEIVNDVIKPKVADGIIQMNPSAYSKINTVTQYHRGNGTDQGWYHLGTQLMIHDDAHTARRAGLYFNSPSIGRGYYVEIMPSLSMTAAVRKTRNEVLLYSRALNGSSRAYGGVTRVITVKNKFGRPTRTKVGSGAKMPIVMEKWYKVDVHFKANTAGDHTIRVDINGKTVISATIYAADVFQQPWVSGGGLFVRGYTKADFNYFYGTAQSVNYDYDTQGDFDYEDTFDAGSFWDTIDGGYSSEEWMRRWVYDERQITKKVNGVNTVVTQRYNQRFYDEFGPMVHEMRLFNVDFDVDKPVIQSRLFNTNSRQSVAIEYVGSPFGAKFVMCNADRQNAVLAGEDTLTAGSDNPITQSFLIYGRPVKQDDSTTITRVDDWALRRRGPIETTYSSKWLQNETAATELANWLTTHWSRSDSRCTAEIFANPLLELGDVVGIEHENKTAATHKYYVVGISNSFAEGEFGMSLTLRRVSA